MQDTDQHKDSPDPVPPPSHFTLFPVYPFSPQSGLHLYQVPLFPFAAESAPSSLCTSCSPIQLCEGLTPTHSSPSQAAQGSHSALVWCVCNTWYSSSCSSFFTWPLGQQTCLVLCFPHGYASSPVLVTPHFFNLEMLGCLGPRAQFCSLLDLHQAP